MISRWKWPSLKGLPVSRSAGTTDVKATVGAKRFVYKLMVISPLAYIGMIGGLARFSADGYVVPACTIQQHEAITAYIGPVSLVESKIVNNKRITPDEVRAIAAVWLDGSQRSVLKPLSSATYDDSVREGVKGQIRQASTQLIMALNRTADRELATGNPGVAARDLIRGLRVAEIVKYSDPHAVTLAGLKQRAVLDRLVEIAPEVPDLDRQMVLQELVALRDNQRPLEPIVRLTKHQYALSKQRMGQEALAIEEPARVVRGASFDLASASAEDLVGALKDPTLLASSSEELPLFISELRMMFQSQDNLFKVLDRAIGAYQPASEPTAPQS
jgi:hypothetical protein